MRIGFIGLGNVGGKLAGSLLRNGFDLTVQDFDREVARPFLDAGAHWGESPAKKMEASDSVVALSFSEGGRLGSRKSVHGGAREVTEWMQRDTRRRWPRTLISACPGTDRTLSLRNV